MNAWKQLHLGEIGKEIEGKSGEIGDGLGGNRSILNIFRHSFCSTRGARIRGEASLSRNLKKGNSMRAGLKSGAAQGDFVL